MTNKKLRVWWMPQIGIEKSFYIPVESPEEAKKVMDLLAAYDCFQYNQNVKPDYCNAGGLEYFNEDTGEWEDWYYDDGENYFGENELDEYCEEMSDRAAELKNFAVDVLSQVYFD